MNNDDQRADNLFSRLFSYTPRDGREPLEDFCTEALAWCLRRSEVFRRKFLAIEGLECIDWGQFPLAVHTQMRFHSAADTEDEDDNGSEPGGRFDLVIHSQIGNDFVAVWEVKVGAQLGKGQMETYRKQLDGGERFQKVPSERRFLFTLTNSHKKDPLAKANVLWSSVQKALMESIENIDGREAEPDGLYTRQICKQFADFLKEKGMEQITLQSTAKEPLSNLMKGIEFRHQLEQILKAIWYQDKTLRVTLNRRPYYNRNADGQQFLGLYNKSDYPYLWLGFRLAPDYDMIVEAKWPKERGALINRISKDGLKVVDNGPEDFWIKQSVIPDYDGKPEKIQSWLTKAALLVKGFASNTSF